MSKVTIALPDSLDAALAERVKTSGAGSTEEYVTGLVEADCRGQELDLILASRSAGPFAPLEADWKERVRALARSRR